MIVVMVTDADGTRGGQIYSKEECIVEQTLTLAGVKEEIARERLQPHGPPMLGDTAVPVDTILAEHCRFYKHGTDLPFENRP
jgi:hypothetical protein